MSHRKPLSSLVVGEFLCFCPLAGSNELFCGLHRRPQFAGKGLVARIASRRYGDYAVDIMLVAIAQRKKPALTMAGDEQRFGSARAHAVKRRIDIFVGCGDVPDVISVDGTSQG